jgi:signal transduction histidine kinase
VTVIVNGSDRPVQIAADQEVVERILFPLIENGCRYATREVTVEVAAQGRRALVSVRDDGPGVDADEVSRIFDPGERGRAGGNGEAGAGLGLALARRLARQVGGEVLAEPAPGGRFRVELPRSDA